jgi:hypothetical protein
MLKSKTFWACLTGGITAMGGYMQGAIDAPTAIQSGFMALTGIFLRHGIDKQKGS